MKMDNLKFAGIDIGSNAIRLIIKNVVPGETYKDAILNKLVYLRLPMRLGGDVFKYGKITDSKIREFMQGLRIYRDLMDYYEIDDNHYRACATSATRSAKNGKQVINKIRKELGLKIDIIDGVEESELLFKTNIYNLPEGHTFLSADLGGGSLQVTLFKDKKLIWTHSYKIGTVRLLNKTVNEKEFEKLNKRLSEIKKEYKDLKIIGSGGNINKISKVIGEKHVERDDIEKLYDKLKKMSVEERIKKYKFRKDRADVIVPAAKIYIDLLKKLDKKKIYVPKIGLADGIIRELYEKYLD